jgi:transcriptional regulator with GAF, ATPase, and Fis domain
MLRLEELELVFWREACRHIEIEEAALRFADALVAHCPLDRLLVIRFDRHHEVPSVVATVPALAAHHGQLFANLDGNAAASLRRWVVARNPVRVESCVKVPRPLASLQLQRISMAQALIIPLTGEHGSLGLAVLWSLAGRDLTARHEDLAKVIQEPMSVALDNDQRIDELNSLRSAAEADRLSLLSRLGRQDLADTIVGQESGLKLVMQRVQLVQRSDVPVLILGETGTGKELVARAIHQESARHAGPFIRVNCGAIPADLIDSQLFGHERGSFTGASDARPGWFERADGGTLFLDEIGELPLEAQVRFLRVLQDGIVERVGATKPLDVHVRVVAATHRDLADMVRAGKFREDLWYRIAVFPVLLPPLRERKGDIASLVEHFAQKAAARFGLSPVSVRPEQLGLLQTYDWPGNVRELGAVIDRAAILGEGKTLEIAKALGWNDSSLVTPGRKSVENPFKEGSMTLDQAMVQHIEQVLRATRGRIEGKGGAAERLAINPHTLRARMRKLGISWKRFRSDDLDE